MIDAETLDLSRCAVLVIRAPVDDGALRALGEDLLRRAEISGQMAPLIVVLRDGEWMESLDEDQMRANGWVRA